MNIEIVDAYVRNIYQVRNVMELMEVVLRNRDYSVETAHALPATS